MTLQEVWQKAAPRGPSDPLEDSCSHDLALLFESVFSVPRSRLPLEGQTRADPMQIAQFESFVQRYHRGEPLQYILGEWEFFGLPFSVGKGVLIPRYDTETLVQAGAGLLKGVSRPVIADLCAGSGCVGVALASLCPDAQVFALELSPDAFPYLAHNVQQMGGRVKPIRCDVLHPPALPPLDLVICNPPYIPQYEMETLDANVKQEPFMALCGGTDGYDFYRALPSLYLPLLKPGGAIAFEVGYDQAQQVTHLLESAGYREIAIYPDLAGISRAVSGKCPSDCVK